MRFVKLAEPRKKHTAGGSGYLKVEDGGKVLVVPRGEIYSFKVKWVEGKSVVVPEADEALHNRFKMNVVVKEGDKYAVKVWEFGVVIYNQLATFAKLTPITKTKVQVSRSGVGKDTLWTLDPMGQIDQASIDKIEKLPLHILGEKKEAPKSAPTLVDEDLAFLNEPPPYEHPPEEEYF